MNINIKTVIKYLAIIIILVIVIFTGYKLFNKNEPATPEVNIPAVQPLPSEEILPPKPQVPVNPQVKKPMTRDENNMPKSDYKVPEIG